MSEIFHKPSEFAEILKQKGSVIAMLKRRLGSGNYAVLGSFEFNLEEKDIDEKIKIRVISSPKLNEDITKLHEEEFVFCLPDNSDKLQESF